MDRTGTDRQSLLLSGLDNALWGLLTVVLLVAVARGSSAEELGAAGVALSIYVLVLALAPVAIGDVLLVNADRASSAAAAGATVALACGASAVVALGALAVSLPVARALWILAGALPPLALHEFARSVAYGRRAVVTALTIDGLWLGSAVVLLSAASAGGWALHAWRALLLWSAGGIAAAIVGLRTLRLRPGRSGVRWLGVNRGLVASFAAGSGLPIIATQVGFLASLGFLDLADFGALRGAFLLFGLLTVVTNALRRPVLAAGGDGTLSERALVTATVALVGSAAALTALLGLLPDELGVEILGSSWDTAQAAVPWLGLAFAGRGVVTAAVWGCMIHGRVRRLLALRVTSAVGAGGGLLLGAALRGPTGAAVGLACGQWMAVLAAVRELATDATPGRTRSWVL